jgi:hypothetical protein
VGEDVEVATGEDGATTPGGPIMVLIITTIMGLIVWTRRRRKRARALR